MRVKRWKKANIHKRYVRHFTLHWQSSRWKASETHFQQTYVNGFGFGLNHTSASSWEQNIRYIYLPSLQLSTIMWLSHLLTSFSSQRIHYLFPKNRVTSMFIPKIPLWIYPVLQFLKYKTKSINILNKNDEKRAITPRWVIRFNSKLQGR